MKNRVKRNPRNGRFTRDYTLIKAFLILTVIGVVTTFTMIGVNNIIAKLKTFEKLIIVENSFAEEVVKELEPDELKSLIPTLYPVCACESDYSKKTPKQFNPDGTVVTGPTNDYGACQISHIHIHNAEAIGYDIMSLSGNIAYANYLYRRDGLSPWNSSKKCWQSKINGI